MQWNGGAGDACARGGVAIAAACVVGVASASAAKAALVRPAWPVVPSPNVGAGDNTLRGVTALSPGDAWAVGSFRDTATGQTGSSLKRGLGEPVQ
jgi:hypothetical protein